MKRSGVRLIWYAFVLSHVLYVQMSIIKDISGFLCTVYAYVLVYIFKSFHFKFACQLILFFVFLLCLIAESCYLMFKKFFFILFCFNSSKLKSIKNQDETLKNVCYILYINHEYIQYSNLTRAEMIRTTTED